MDKKKVTGIGGVFFKCKDPKLIKEWYNRHLGFETDEYGSMFTSRDIDNPEKVTYLQWSAFDANTDYFHPSAKEFMINYRVNDLETLVKQLKAEGVEVVDDIAVYEYGKFIHILDPEGNKIELWEPVDGGFTSEKQE